MKDLIRWFRFDNTTLRCRPPQTNFTASYRKWESWAPATSICCFSNVMCQDYVYLYLGSTGNIWGIKKLTEWFDNNIANTIEIIAIRCREMDYNTEGEFYATVILQTCEMLMNYDSAVVLNISYISQWCIVTRIFRMKCSHFSDIYTTYD